jgi:hypothetical protein
MRMAFIRTKRVDGKHRQRVLMHLGIYATVEDAIKGWLVRVEKLRAEADGERERFRVYRTPKVRKLEAEAANLEEKAEQLRSLSGD